MPMLLFVLLAAVAEPESYERGKIVERLATMSDPSITYAYYLPSAYDPSARWPILYVFDPGKRGPFAAELFRDAAEAYGWIVVSSNDTSSSTDWPPNAKAINAMWPDAQRRFSVDTKRIYTAGMSGGAIMAWSLAKISKSVAGVIGCSGRLADDHDTDGIAFDWFGTAGIDDFNYSETRLIESKLAAAHATYRVKIVEGGHRWPSAAVMREAVEWMEWQAMRRGARVRDEAFIERMQQREIEAAKADAKRDPREERRAAEFESSAKQRTSRAVQQFATNDEELPATLIQALDIPRLKKIATGSNAQAHAARRVLELTRFQLRMLARELEQHGRVARAETVRSVAREIEP